MAQAPDLAIRKSVIAAFRWTASQWEKGAKKANYVTFDGTTEDPLSVFELLTEGVDTGDDAAELGELRRRLAAAAMEMQDALLRQVRKCVSHGRR